MAARLLLAYPPRRPKQWTEADIDIAVETAMARVLDRLYDLQPTVGEDGAPRAVLVRLSDRAKTIWTSYYNAHAREQADATDDLAAAFSKLEEYAARLALILHFVRSASGDPAIVNPDVLDEASMKAGVELAEWFKHEARRVYQALTESDEERNRRQLEEWIHRRGGSATVREAQQGCAWLKPTGAAETALGALAKAGRGKWTPAPPTAKGGRPTRVFTLTAEPIYASTIYETPKSQQVTLATRYPSIYETPAKANGKAGYVDVDGVDGSMPLHASHSPPARFLDADPDHDSGGGVDDIGF